MIHTLAASLEQIPYQTLAPARLGQKPCTIMNVTVSIWWLVFYGINILITGLAFKEMLNGIKNKDNSKWEKFQYAVGLACAPFCGLYMVLMGIATITIKAIYKALHIKTMYDILFTRHFEDMTKEQRDYFGIYFKFLSEKTGLVGKRNRFYIRLVKRVWAKNPPVP